MEQQRAADARGVADEDFDGGHRANRFWGQLVIGFAIADAYLIQSG